MRFLLPQQVLGRRSALLNHFSGDSNSMSSVTLEIDPEEISKAYGGAPGPTMRVAMNPDTVEQDLARLVLGLMAFLRQLMELQAIRRMEAGTLSETEEEQVGATLMRSETALYEMAEKFGLGPDDLSLDLGPLGKTI